MLRRLLVVLALVVALAVVGLYVVGLGTFGDRDGAGEIEGAARPEAVQRTHEAAVAGAAAEIGVAKPKQVLFGDLHVHTTISFDAFMTSLPSLGGEGAHPPADACDFARYCSALDFWSINDHAEAVTSRMWDDTISSIRACNARAGDPADPDLVSYLGWEWTQVGTTPDDHYGHKNVVLAGIGDEEITARPIASTGRTLDIRLGGGPRPVVVGAISLASGDARFHTFARYLAEQRAESLCDPDVATRELPDDCVEVAETPAALYRKLDEWGVDSVVIPHGTTWGFYTPPGSTWDKQLAGDMHDEKRQTLLEVYSGHGDSEVYRPWRAVDFDGEGEASCPAQSPEYLPSCWRAGEIIRERCLAEGTEPEACESRAAETRQLAARSGVAAHRVVVGARAEEWLDAGQCRDCDQPSFNYRPGGSAQYILALGNFDEDASEPRRFRMGFMASSDNHYARPGTGFKESNRTGNTESRGTRRIDSPVANLFRAPPEEPTSEPRAFDIETTELQGFQLVELERQASFFMTGGLVAAHAEGRDRGAIWDALQRKEVYGTSGPRILLWFDLLNPPGSSGRTLPMGGEVEMSDPPIFQVRAVGSFEQKPGCPDYATGSLSPESIERLCKGECYNPSDQRRRITRIEIVRVRPQIRPGEDPAALIDDPWQRFECEADPSGCAVTFTDPDFASTGRDAVYYARAYESPAPAINAAGANCTYDENGDCVRTNPCPGPNGAADDCLAEHEPRAWSSPIYVDFAPRRVDHAAR